MSKQSKKEGKKEKRRQSRKEKTKKSRKKKKREKRSKRPQQNRIAGSASTAAGHCHNYTYASAMYQFFAANDAAARKSARPTRLMVGAMASGPMNRSNIPISPLTPRITSNRDAMIIAPCICNSDKRTSS